MPILPEVEATDHRPEGLGLPEDEEAMEALRSALLGVVVEVAMDLPPLGSMGRSTREGEAGTVLLRPE